MGSMRAYENLGIFQDLNMFLDCYLWLVCLDRRL